MFLCIWFVVHSIGKVCWRVWWLQWWIMPEKAKLGFVWRAGEMYQMTGTGNGSWVDMWPKLHTAGGKGDERWVKSKLKNKNLLLTYIKHSRIEPARANGQQAIISAHYANHSIKFLSQYHTELDQLRKWNWRVMPSRSVSPGQQKTTTLVYVIKNVNKTQWKSRSVVQVNRSFGTSGSCGIS